MTMLFFVEDPGAVNFVVPIILKLKLREVFFIVISSGHATRLLEAKGITSKPARHKAGIDHIFEANRLSLLIVGTSENQNSLGLALTAMAKVKGIPSVGVIDCAANSAYRFRGTTQNALTYAPDWLFVVMNGPLKHIKR